MTTECSMVMSGLAAALHLLPIAKPERAALLVQAVQQTHACAAEFAVVSGFWLCKCRDCAAAEAAIANLACSSFMPALGLSRLALPLSSHLQANIWI